MYKLGMVNTETKACGPVLPLTLGWEKSARLRKHVLKPLKTICSDEDASM